MIAETVRVITYGVPSLAERRQALMVSSTVLKVPAPEVMREVATTVSTAASPLADYIARYLALVDMVASRGRRPW